ncbi:hypothetical protein U8V72_21135 [Priestia filamentosa]
MDITTIILLIETSVALVLGVVVVNSIKKESTHYAESMEKLKERRAN